MTRDFDFAQYVLTSSDQDLISRGLSGGVSQFNKFGYRTSTAAASGEQTIWASTDNLTILTSASTFTITYNNTTDGSGTTGATILQFYYLDSDEKLAVGLTTQTPTTSP